MADQSDPVVHLASLPHSQAWSRRAMQPFTMLKIGRAPWLDAHDLPNYSEWLKYITTIDPERASRIDLRFYMTRGLVGEIIYAAGGIERELMVLKEIISIAQQFCDAHNITPPKDSLVTPSVGHSAAHHASYTLLNGFTWARSVKDRVERQWRGNAYGLLPSLKDSDLKRRIKTEYDRLAEQLESSRYATNYTLHAGALPGPSTPTLQLWPDGTVYLQFPDVIGEPIITWDQLTYDEDRDAVSVLEEQFDAVADFIDGMLDAFDDLSV
jgi:hypothetical protein